MPTARTPDKSPPQKQMLTVQIDRQGALYLDGKPIQADAFEKRLKALIGGADPKEQSLMVEADKDVPFQNVVTVLDAARRVGISKLGLNVKQEKKGAPAR
jgi:biopolymer transport protein ExbD